MIDKGVLTHEPNQFMVGDIVTVHHYHNDNLYYLIIDVVVMSQHYMMIHLPSGEERRIYFPSAHREYRRVRQ
jgi:hypothetical protein